MPKDIAKLVEQGNKAFQRKKYKQAQEYYEQALELEPESQLINFNLGVTCQSQGKSNQAIIYYEKADSFVDAKNNLGVIFEEQGDLKKAREYYQAAVDLSPGCKEAVDNLKNTSMRVRSDKRDKAGKEAGAQQISEKVLDKIRKSFNYKGLLKALRDGIISVEDIKAEAEQEARNPRLAAEERVHTVLLGDKGSWEDNRGLEGKGKLGSGFGEGWQGIDKDGDLVKVIERTADGWVRFQIEKAGGGVDAFSYPVHKFFQIVEANSLYELSEDEAQDLAVDNLAKLDDQGRIDLLHKIHKKTMAKLRDIKAKQRKTIEQFLRQNEAMKIKETLSRIQSS